jgi:hypothetical protein
MCQLADLLCHDNLEVRYCNRVDNLQDKVSKNETFRYEIRRTVNPGRMTCNVRVLKALLSQPTELVPDGCMKTPWTLRVWF